MRVIFITRERYNLQDPLVLYLGQLHDGQYVELFIKSAEVVLEHCPQTKFMIIGGGSRFNDLKTLVKNLAIEEILIPARDFNRGNIAADNDSFGKRLGIDRGIFPCFAEYDFYIPSDGKYELWVKYAAETPRPCRIYLDGKLLCAEGLKGTSGGWIIDKARWFKQVGLEMESKFHILEFVAQGHLPHLEFIKFKKIAPFNLF